MSIDAKIIMVEGLPGGGKSFHLVGEVLEQIIQNKCRVYTNLPLRHKVMRQWLRNRGGEAFARLIHSLTEDHFKRFVDRAAVFSKFRERYKVECQHASITDPKKSFRETTFRKVWQSEHGDDIIDGPDANWIPPHCCIIIDEAQHWYPAADNRDRKESPSLLSYLTMHRHFLHRVYLATQDIANVSITWRRLIREYRQVRRRGNDKLAWGLQWRHFGLNPMSVVQLDARALTTSNADLRAPIDDSTFFPSWPKYRWRFRLYNSYTNVGSVRGLEAVAARAQREAGVEGLTLAALSEDQEMRNRRYRWWLALGVGGVLGCVGGATGGLLTAVAPTVNTPAVAALEPAKPLVPAFTVSTVSKSGVLVGSSYLKVGSVHDGFTLVGIVDGRALFAAGDRMFMARKGTIPRDIGTVDDVDRRLRVAIDARSQPAGGGPEAFGPSPN